MLRGNALAKVDGKGRLKLPAQFRSYIESTFGTELFVTSHRGDSALIYPVPVYAELEEKMAASSRLSPKIKKLRIALNYYGQSATMDAQGRVLVHPLLRDAAALSAEVAVLGMQNCLEVWNHDVFAKQVVDNPLTDDDLEELSELGF